MDIDHHLRSSTGTEVTLNGNELATAIDAYITAHNVYVGGPRTVHIVVDGKRLIARDVQVVVFVDPSGRVVDNRE